MIKTVSWTKERVYHAQSSSVLLSVFCIFVYKYFCDVGV
jgi:hypothetical protein